MYCVYSCISYLSNHVKNLFIRIQKIMSMPITFKSIMYTYVYVFPLLIY